MITRCALVLGSVLWCSSARADSHPRVQLEIDGCVDASHDEIRRVVSVELGALLSGAGEATTDRTRASVGCDGAVVVLRVDDPITGKSLSRTVDIGSAIPRARARLVALAIVELISASWTELGVNAQPQDLPSDPRPTLEPRPAVLESLQPQTDRLVVSPYRVSLLGGGLKFFAKTDLLVGAVLRVAHDRSAPIGWMVDAQAHRGSESTSLGQVFTDVIGVGLVAVVHHAWARSSTHVGGGVRGGAVRLSGVPTAMMGVQGSRFWAPWIGPLVLGNVELAVTHRFTVDVTLEGGYVVSPVGGLVSDRREVAVDGAWLEVHVGVGVFL